MRLPVVGHAFAAILAPELLQERRFQIGLVGRCPSPSSRRVPNGVDLALKVESGRASVDEVRYAPVLGKRGFLNPPGPRPADVRRRHMNERGFPAGLRERQYPGGAHRVLLKRAVNGLVEDHGPGKVDDEIDFLNETLALSGRKSPDRLRSGRRPPVRSFPPSPIETRRPHLLSKPRERAGLKHLRLQPFGIGNDLSAGTDPRPDQEIDPRHFGGRKQDLLHESLRQKPRRARHEQRLAAQKLRYGLHNIPMWTKNPSPRPRVETTRVLKNIRLCSSFLAPGGRVNGTTQFRNSQTQPQTTPPEFIRQTKKEIQDSASSQGKSKISAAP